MRRWDFSTTLIEIEEGLLSGMAAKAKLR